MLSKVFFTTTAIVSFLVFSQYTKAQVTIGTDSKPVAGALLELTQGTVTTKGLGLPRVSLTSLTDITNGDISGVDNSNKDAHIGLVVYNVNRCVSPERTAIGVYVWNGDQWSATNSANQTSTIMGKSGNIYRTASFGDAGIWMIDNLAETEYDSDVTGTITASYNPSPSSTTAQYYYFPTNQTSYTGAEATDRQFYDQHKNANMGLLYTWVAASNGVYDSEYSSAGEPTKPTVIVQGICPNGWYLPSDYDWGLLDREVSLHPEKYSSVTTPTVWNDADYWKDSSVSSWYGGQGTAMKSECPAPESSIPTQGKSSVTGFDILLVGFIRNGMPTNYGEHSFFWSSTSISSSATPQTSWYRGYQATSTGSGRGSAYDRSNLHSVRCKKRDS